MGSLTIRNIDDSMKAELRVRAAHHGRSMEEEARVILRSALSQDRRAKKHLVDAIRERFAGLGGVDLPEIPRGDDRDPPDFSE
jgi:plasmid stability protein